MFCNFFSTINVLTSKISYPYDWFIVIPLIAMKAILTNQLRCEILMLVSEITKIFLISLVLAFQGYSLNSELEKVIYLSQQVTFHLLSIRLRHDLL